MIVLLKMIFFLQMMKVSDYQWVAGILKGNVS